MSRARKTLLPIVVAALAALASARLAVAEDGTGTSTSQQLFIDQRRLPDDAEKAAHTPASDNSYEKRKAAEQKELDELAAKLKAEEEALAAREAEAHKKFEELKHLSDEADVKRKEDQERLSAREAEAQKQLEEAKRLADEARSKLQEKLQKQLELQNGAASPSASDTPPGQNSRGPEQSPPHAAPNVPAIALTCPDAALTADPLPGGRSKILVQSRCRHGQDVSLQYGPIAMRRAFDNNGDAAFVADMFLGVTANTEISFADGQRQHVELAPGDLDEVIKVAILWNAPVNLDLHAFEYAAIHGEPGDVWSGAPRDASTTSTLVAKDGRGHGFMSSTGDGKTEGAKVEVFTFLQSKQQNRGAIAMALDYETRGTEHAGDACGSGRYAQIPIEVVVRDAHGAITRQNGLIASVPCGQTLSSEARYQTDVVPDIRIHNAH